MKTTVAIVYISECMELLSKPEVFSSELRLKKCAEIKNEAVRLRYLAAELALSRALTGDRLAPPVYRYGKNGKPETDDGFISLSHSGDIAAAAYSDCPVGIDVEEIRAVDPRIAKRILSENELTEYENTSDEGYLLKRFVMKEAFFKMTGEGIFGGASSVEIKNGIVLRCDDPAGFIYEIPIKNGFCVISSLLPTAYCLIPNP